MIDVTPVERIVDRIDDPKSVRVPGALVDFVVVAEPEQHWQTFGERFNEITSGQWINGIGHSAFIGHDLLGA